MTSDTLERLKQAYRAGTITVRDEGDMINELIKISDAQMESRADVIKRFDDMRDSFVAAIFDE